MKLKGRLDKLEVSLKGSNGKYKDVYISVWQTEKPGIYLAQGDGIEFEGTETEVKEFIRPFEDGGAFTVWINVVHEWTQ